MSTNRQVSRSQRCNTTPRTIGRLTLGKLRGHLQLDSLSGALRVRKDIERVQRSTQPGWKPGVEYKSTSRFDEVLHSKGLRNESWV